LRGMRLENAAEVSEKRVLCLEEVSGLDMCTESGIGLRSRQPGIRATLAKTLPLGPADHQKK
jgi:hypothetical protein